MNRQESFLDKSIDEIDLRQESDDDVMNFLEANEHDADLMQLLNDHA